MIKPAYSVSFLLSINIFVWQNVLYFLDAPRTISSDPNTRKTFGISEYVYDTVYKPIEKRLLG